MDEKELVEYNEPQKRTSFDDLSDKEKLAVQLRWQGKSHKEIARQTGYAEATSRKLFVKDGRLVPYYDMFVAEIRKGPVADRVQAAIDKAKATAVDCVDALIDLKSHSNPAAALKATEILLRVCGIGETFALRAFFQNKPYDLAKKIVNDLFVSLYGRGYENLVVMDSIIKDGAEVNFKIGEAPQTEAQQEESK